MPGLFYVAAEAIIEKDGLILITKRSIDREHQPGTWETLTGRLEPGETFQQGIRREVKEEVGLEVKVMQPLNTFHFYRGPNREEHVGVTFWCKYVSGEVTLDTREQTDYKWVTSEQALEWIQDESIRESIQKFETLIS